MTSSVIMLEVATAEPQPNVWNLMSLMRSSAYLDVDVHHVAADGVAHAADGDVRALQRAHVARVAEVLEGLLGVLRRFHRSVPFG